MLILKLTPRELRHRGYRLLTFCYRIYDPDPSVAEHENSMFHDACRQLDGCDAVASETLGGVYVWRHEGEMLDLPKEL